MSFKHIGSNDSAQNNNFQYQADKTGLIDFYHAGLRWLVLAMLVFAAFGLVHFLGAPIALVAVVNALFSGSFVYVTAITYGIVNDIFAAKTHLPYFLLGHQPKQHSLVRSNSEIVNASVWGIAAVHPLAAIAAIVFTIAYSIVGGLGLPFLGFLLPAIPVLALCIIAYASRTTRDITKYLYSFLILSDYQANGRDYFINQICEKNSQRSSYDLKFDYERAFLSNGERNLIGFKWMPICAVVSLITLMVLSAHAASIFPAVGLMVNIVPVLTVAGVMGAFCLGMGYYSYCNQNTQVDNAYKFPEEVKVDSEEFEDSGVNPGADDASLSPYTLGHGEASDKGPLLAVGMG